jgi:hypothetical protein
VEILTGMGGGTVSGFTTSSFTVAPGGGMPGAFYSYGSIGDGAVQYDFQLSDDLESTVADPPGPAWVRDWLGIDYLATVRGAKPSQLDEQSLGALRALSGLRSLEINDTVHPIDALMHDLSHFPQLEKLALNGAPVTDDQLKVLPSLARLRILEIQNCGSITDAGLEQITRLAGLERLTLRGETHLTDAALARIGRLKNLESLSLGFDKPVSDAVLEKLPGLKRLRTLSISLDPAGGANHLGDIASLEELICAGLSDENLAGVARLTKLKLLSLSTGPQVSAAGLKNLEKLPNLETLTFTFMPGLDEEALAQVARLPKLNQLVIQGESRLADASLEAISGASHLRVLSLSECQGATDRGLAQLATLKDLEMLLITSSEAGQFSAAAIGSLRTSLPRCQIFIHEPPSSPAPSPAGGMSTP